MKKIVSVTLGIWILMFIAAGCAVSENAAVSTSGTAPVSATAPAGESAPASGHVPEVSGDSQSMTGVSVAREEQPDNDWKPDKPENRGMDADVLAALHEAAKKDESVHSVVTVKDGYLVDEYYKEGYDENSVFRLASCTKSFSGALIGIAIEQEALSGIDARLAEFFPELAEDDGKQEITIENLLTHTSGIEWYEWNGGNSFGQLSRSENWVEYIFSRQMAAKPGEVFNYTTGGSHLLSAILQNVTGETAYEFGLKHMFEPMGMDSVKWRADPQGVTDGGNGISMTARDAAKFGQLYLDKGKWRERQIIPEAWVEQSVAVQYARSGNSGSYGYQWWLRPFGAENYNTYYAMGHGGQYIFVVPELRLVTVITGRFQDTYAPWPYFSDYILASCGQAQRG